MNGAAVLGHEGVELQVRRIGHAAAMTEALECEPKLSPPPTAAVRSLVLKTFNTVAVLQPGHRR